MTTRGIIPMEVIEQKIFLIRGQRVMLDKDLAELYGVETFNLNKAVKRNIDRFPDDFMFQLVREEFENLIFHFGISSTPANRRELTGKAGWGGTRKLPYAFTEQGVAMLSSVLRSKRAVHVNIAIMRAFVRLREILAAHKDLASKLGELEKKYEGHDKKIQSIFQAIRQLMEPPKKMKRQIGFRVQERPVAYIVRRKRLHV